MVFSAKKKALALTAILLTTAILLSGTFAWQSLNQEALNYVRGGANPGGRLHDDFNNITDEIDAVVKTYDKDVYVENFTSAANDGVEIFARIRLEEFMAIGENAGPDSRAGDAGIARVLNREIFVPGNTGSPFRDYWKLSWEAGGSTVYMPTFNKNKDSLIADINGTSDDDFSDYIHYATDEQHGTAAKEGYVIQDRDDNTEDELTNAAHLKDLIAKGAGSTHYDAYSDHIKVSNEKITHQAKHTLTAGASMSVSDWLNTVAVDGGYDKTRHGNCWVWDEDGWFYWTAPIAPGTATGLLLDQIQRTTQTIDGQWYYELNVVGQFITADDLGSEELGTGFYNTEKGAEPTENALQLLSTIGVDTTGELGVPSTVMLQDETVAVGEEAALREALANGSNVTLVHDIALESTVRVEEAVTIDLGGHTISASPDFRDDALFVLDENTWLDFDGRGLLQAPEDGYAVRIESGSLLYIWDGTFAGGAGVVYVDDGTAVIVDGTFYLQNEAFGQIIDWNPAAAGEVVVYSGTFHNFDPANAAGRNLLADGYVTACETDGEDTLYTVVFDANEDLPDEEPAEPEPTEPDLPDDTSQVEKDVPDTEEGGQLPADDGLNDSEKGEDAAQQPAHENEADEAAGMTGGGISGKADVPPAADEGGAETAADTTAENET